MSRFCHIQNCDSPGIVFVRGHWYCSKHKPVFFTDETVRLHGVNKVD